jgi:transposase InsO family protein
VYDALEGAVARRVVRRLLVLLKARRRLRRRQGEERDRVSILVQARDVLWSLDATHLGRDANGEVQAEALRDPASTSALSLSAGRPSTGKEVVRLLEHTAQERGGEPLVLAIDGGSNYRSEEVRQWADEHKVVLLKSEPRVPQHNAWVERGHRELKEDAELGRGCVLEALPCARWTVIGGHRELVDGWSGATEGSDLAREAGADTRKVACEGELPGWCKRLKRSMVVLNEHRARSSRGGFTAYALDAVLPRGDHWVCRESFHRTVCRNVELAELGAKDKRARRRARRNAILCTLEEHGLVRRTRGGRPWSHPKPESQA